MYKSDLKPKTETFICDADEQALRTNYVKHKVAIQQKVIISKYAERTEKLYGKITSQCTPLAQKQCKRRHDNIAGLVH